MNRKKPRRRKTPAERAAYIAREIGMPEPQVERGGFVEHELVDLASRRRIGRTVRMLYPSVVDRWLAEGGIGFEAPQRRAIDHVRMLWACSGQIGRLVARLDRVGDGVAGAGYERDSWSQVEALAQLGFYERGIPRAYWQVFENVVRHDMAAGKAGTHLARGEPQRIAAVRTCVGFVASKIAEWRRF